MDAENNTTKFELERMSYFRCLTWQDLVQGRSRAIQQQQLSISCWIKLPSNFYCEFLKGEEIKWKIFSFILAAVMWFPHVHKSRSCHKTNRKAFGMHSENNPVFPRNENKHGCHKWWRTFESSWGIWSFSRGNGLFERHIWCFKNIYKDQGLL